MPKGIKFNRKNGSEDSNDERTETGTAVAEPEVTDTPATDSGESEASTDEPATYSSDAPFTDIDLANERITDLEIEVERLKRQEGRFTLSEHDNTLVSRSLTDRADRLEKVAKMTSQEGYPKQAAVLKGDAAYSREQILPMFDPQVKVFEETEAEAVAGVANTLHPILSTAEFIKRPTGEVAEEIAKRVVQFGKEIHVRSYSAGVADRTKYSEAGLMIAALPALKQKPGDSSEETTT